jgi:hypothetical protein
MPGMGHTRPPIQLLPGALPLGVVTRSWREADHPPHLKPGLGMSGATPLMHHIPSWDADGQLCLHLPMEDELRDESITAVNVVFYCNSYNQRSNTCT